MPQPADRVHPYGREHTTLLSAPVKEIIGANPGFMVQKGTFIIFLIVVILFAGTWFIKYPDIVTSSASLSLVNAPKPLVSKQTGKLAQLKLANGVHVKEGAIIGKLESTADAEDVLMLENQLNRLLETETESTGAFNFTKLGELQPDYQQFIQAFIQYKNFGEEGLYARKRIMLKADMDNLKHAEKNLLQQKSLFEQDLSLSQTTFEANQVLLNDKVISPQEYRELKSSYINKKMSLPQMKTALIDNKRQQSDKEKEILELESQMSAQKIIFQEAINNLKSRIGAWKQRYLLIAPVSGQLNFTSFIQEEQQIQENQIIAFITPGNTGCFMQVNIPQNNFGKVSIGQKVLLKFPAYPWQEFGIVEGRIDYIASVAVDATGYIAKVSLPNGLITNQNKLIAYREGLTANAEIITKDRRLLERFYSSIKENISR